MTQMEYITLKTPEGQLVGHARVREGAVSIHLREPMEGQAAVFTSSGAKLGPLGMTMQFQEPVLGVALLDRGRMAAWGIGRNGNLTPGRMEEQLRGAGNPLEMTAGAGTPERARPEPAEVREGAGEPIAKPEQSLRPPCYNTRLSAGGCAVWTLVSPPVAGLTSAFQRVLPSTVCGFITIKRIAHRRISDWWD